MFHSSTDVTLRVPAEIDLGDDPQFYDCEFCTSGGWSSETEVEMHKASTHWADISNLKSISLCKMCLKRFDCALDLLRHVKKVHLLSSEDAYRVEREIFICDYCNQIFFNKELLHVHIKHFHRKYFPKSFSKDLIRCPKCKIKINVYNIWFHFQIHSYQSVSLCRICLHKCKSQRQLQDHLKIHPKLLRCEICAFETKRDDLFHKHIHVRHKTPIPRKRFMAIQKYFSPPREYNMAFEKFNGVRGLKLTNGIRICIMCREICVGYVKMKTHIFEEHVFKEVVVKNVAYCNCGEKFTSKILLKQHIFKMKGDHKVLDV